MAAGSLAALAASGALLAPPALASGSARRSAPAATASAGSSAGASTSTASASATPAPPATGQLALLLPDAFSVGRAEVSIPGRPVHVQGIVRPYVPGQSVSFRVYLGSRLIVDRTVAIARSAQSGEGTFTQAFSSPLAGDLRIAVSHAASQEQAGFGSSRMLWVLRAHANFGAHGEFVRLLQQRLALLHVYVRQSGRFDSFTALALDAYHRLLGWGTYRTLDARTVAYLLDGFGRFHVRFPGQERHAEGDLSHQLLALIDGSRVRYIFPISSGKPSTPTILGSFRIYSRVPGYLPDGMYYSSFFYRGYAIHGYDPAPDYPASHGCMRLPIQDAVFVYDWLRMRDWVDTYYR
jgi:hypothetical protein